jgi:cold shock CspA family protein
MSPEFVWSPTRSEMPKRLNKPPRPIEPSGEPVTGRIVTLMVGQGHGYIRLSNDREVYFHRADLLDGVSFNDLQIGDVVKFALLEDAISGARALGVVRHKRPR